MWNDGIRPAVQFRCGSRLETPDGVFVESSWAAIVEAYIELNNDLLSRAIRI